jgi:hypothetical protein
MRLRINRWNKGAPTSMHANLSLLEGLLHAARSRFATLQKMLAELPTPAEPRAGGNREGRASAPAVSSADMIVLVRVMDQIADKLQVESKQIWASAEYVSDNVQKVAFGRWRLRDNQTRDDRSAIDDKLKRLPRLAILLVEMVTLLEEAIVDLRPRQQR